jgi:type IV pilus assembly protein PilB
MSQWWEILIQQRSISPDQWAEAQRLAKESNIDEGEALVRLGYSTSDDVMRAKARQHGMEYVELSEIVIPPSVVELVPESVARENAILPMAEVGDALKVIISDPLDFDVLEKLRFILDRKVDIALAPREKIVEAINRHYGQAEGESADSMLQEFTDTAIDFTETEGDSLDSDDELVDESSAPVVRLVQLIINEAVQLRASDIHIEPFEDRVRIRYRIDGRLVERDSPPRRLLGAIISRVKILSKIDIAERRRPQDGRIKVSVGEKELDLRVSLLPTNHGQTIVMRLLDKDSIRVSVKQLGLSARDDQVLKSCIARPNGIILVTGPTGSGKTTTLYAILNELIKPDTKIITAEDPVEYYLRGINQVEVKHQIGLDFARIIRAVLRQAPDIILVGEMRDTETAQMGIQAALTGHLVFSTLHTNDAPGAVTRLIDMGVPGYLVASSVMAIMAQRLVRAVCSKCKIADNPAEAVLEAAGISREMAKNATFVRGKGCPNCQKSGFRGRRAVFEVMPMTTRIRELTFEAASTQEINKAAIAEGMTTLYDDGVRKVMEGVTTIEEVMRVARRND